MTGSLAQVHYAAGMVEAYAGQLAARTAPSVHPELVTRRGVRSAIGHLLRVWQEAVKQLEAFEGPQSSDVDLVSGVGVTAAAHPHATSSFYPASSWSDPVLARVAARARYQSGALPQTAPELIELLRELGELVAEDGDLGLQDSASESVVGDVLDGERHDAGAVADPGGLDVCSDRGATVHEVSPSFVTPGAGYTGDGRAASVGDPSDSPGSPSGRDESVGAGVVASRVSSGSAATPGRGDARRVWRSPTGFHVQWFPASAHDHAGIRVTYIPDGHGYQAISLWLATSDDWATVIEPTIPVQLASAGNQTIAARDLAGAAFASIMAADLVVHCHEEWDLLEVRLENHVKYFVAGWVD